MASPSALQLPLHRIEQQQDPKGREVQRLLLQAHVQLRGSGDVGPALAVVDGESLTLQSHRRLQRRTLKTVFGPIDIDRMGYGARGHPSIHPLDEDLQLPERCSPTNCKGDWSRLLSKARSAKRLHEFSTALD
jgi:hypothetical protein